MEFLGVNIAMVAAISVVVLGIVEWFKNDKMPKWAVRLISLAVSFAVTGLFLMVNPMTWQAYIATSFSVFFIANGIWHTADSISGK